MTEQLLLDASTPAPMPPMVTCFSLHQPYAGLVAAGLKDETRLFPWPAKARPFPAPLLICSTMAPPDKAAASRVWASGTLLFEEADLWRRGVALAVVDIVGDRDLVEADMPRSWYWDPEGDARHAPGRVRRIWTVANVRRVQPFPVSGGQGFSKCVSRERVEAAMRAWRATCG